jgi:hypothetical protein
MGLTNDGKNYTTDGTEKSGLWIQPLKEVDYLNVYSLKLR